MKYSATRIVSNTRLVSSSFKRNHMICRRLKNCKKSEENSFWSTFSFEAARAIVENILQKVEISLQKSCLVLSDEEFQYIKKNVLGDKNFVESVKNSACPVQVFFFPKNDIIERELLGVAFKMQNQELFACTYFCALT
ncbi:hypothetical protein ABK040_015652 [Willaertia magna]